MMHFLLKKCTLFVIKSYSYNDLVHPKTHGLIRQKKHVKTSLNRPFICQDMRAFLKHSNLMLIKREIL